MGKTVRQLLDDAKDSVLSYNHWPMDWNEDRRDRKNVACVYLTQKDGKGSWWIGIANIVKYPGDLRIEGPGIEIRCHHTELQEGFDTVYKWVLYQQSRVRKQHELSRVTGPSEFNPLALRHDI